MSGCDSAHLRCSSLPQLGKLMEAGTCGRLGSVAPERRQSQTAKPVDVSSMERGLLRMGLDTKTGLERGRSATPVAHLMSSLILNTVLLELFYLKSPLFSQRQRVLSRTNLFFPYLLLLPFFSIIHDQQNSKNIPHLPAGCRDLR